MTRFARAKGSKASNERVPEEATSWTELKQQMEQKKEELKQRKKKAEFETLRKTNYESFLAEKDQSKDSKWADFADVMPDHKMEISEKDLKEVKSESDDNEVPEEVSSKIKPESCKIKELKRKKVPLKIQSVDKPVNHIEKDKKIEKKFKKSLEELTPQEQAKINKIRQKRLKLKEKKKRLKAEKGKSETENGQQVEEMKSPKNTKHDITMKDKMDNKIKLSNFNGSIIKRETASKLYNLKRQLISKGLPQSQINTIIKLERRRAEKALARERQKACYKCREFGHTLAQCPYLDGNQETVGAGICFKCGSTEHTHFECKIRADKYKFATCFICKEEGHISRQCPDNKKGLYPNGGCCKVCGDVTHLKKDCLQYQAQQEAKAVTLDTISCDNVDSLEDGNREFNKLFKPTVKKVTF